MNQYVVELQALTANIRAVKKKAGDAAVWAVVKGNGYGLGLIPFASALRDQGIDRFAVTQAADGMRLREAGFSAEKILLLRPTIDPEELQMILRGNLTACIGSYEQASVLNGTAEQAGMTVDVHIEIDTGMGRYGFLPSETGSIANLYQYLGALHVTGMYTHFHSAFASKKKTEEQYAQFLAVVEEVRSGGWNPGEIHCCNSSALFRRPDMAHDGVRIGSAFLGRLAFRTGEKLTPIGWCESPVEAVRWLPKGATTGYGATWKAKKPTRIAILPVGTYHGFAVERGCDLFRRRDAFRKILSGIKGVLLPGKLTVVIRGKRCRVVGRVGMLHAAVDVSGLKDLAAGEMARVEINPLLMKGMPVVYR